MKSFVPLAASVRRLIRPTPAASAPPLKILLAFDSFNSMSQRIALECQSKGHAVQNYPFKTPEDLMEVVATNQPQIIICPFLTRKIPPEIYLNKKVPCLIVHPGIEGDRGPSSIDWALREERKTWGVTIIQADKEMDAGDIWDTNTFSIERGLGVTRTKSSLYRFECIDAAVAGVHNALTMFQRGLSPRPLDYSRPSVIGSLRPRMKQSDRRIDWNLDARKVAALIGSSDSQPGTAETLQDGVKYFLYGAHVESDFTTHAGMDVKTILGKRDDAVLVKCGQGSAVWLSHLKKEKSIKLPATWVLPEKLVASVPEIPLPPQSLQVPFRTTPKTFQEIFTWEHRGVCYLWFDFYNGAMHTEQCRRLAATLRHIKATSPARVLVLMGGLNFFSNGINLNTIEASADPAEESWRNINAIDEVVKEILLCSDKLTVTAMYGNSGAGGVMASLAADFVWAHDGVVLNPTYKTMDLYGSEYWTYSLPRRVGQAMAKQLTDSEGVPVSASQALAMGMIDRILSPSVGGFLDRVVESAEELIGSKGMEELLRRKKARTENGEFQALIQSHRDWELEHMKRCFRSEGYHGKRKAFVYKYEYLPCNASADGLRQSSQEMKEEANLLGRSYA
ncbi:Hydrogenase maturation factor HoxX [Hypsibius exemplaris]|uniref:Hydrogenase maturation factor HoxX n=1 Tax=Hypsibius exemplaris TaxID=2072580 RepID=A0A1W0WQZ8_HYPEX|nr:Hydrogenase maturation factor HoxX [Hypsibius exemplaris]